MSVYAAEPRYRGLKIEIAWSPSPPPHPPVAAAAARFAKALIPFIVRPFDTFVSYEM